MLSRNAILTFSLPLVPQLTSSRVEQKRTFVARPSTRPSGRLKKAWKKAQLKAAGEHVAAGKLWSPWRAVADVVRALLL